MTENILMEMNKTFTENAAVSNISTGSDCLDLFSVIGALRHEKKERIISSFIRAYTENADMAMKIIFFARDIREGLGEREIFRVIFRWLAENEPESVKKNIEYVDEYGRYDDLLTLFDTPCEKQMLSFLRKRFYDDIGKLEKGNDVSLLGKWLPSVNASNAKIVKMGKRIARAFNLSDADYRKKVSALRAEINIIENHLREMDYSFDYGKQPSRAMLKYRKAFIRNDYKRYMDFISNVSSGRTRLHADNIYPYELVDKYIDFEWDDDNCFMKKISVDEKEVLNAAWKALPDYGGSENAIAVIDTSGSMYSNSRPLPASVALSLGLYFAERNKGIFANKFIEFSARPRLIEIKGNTFADRLRYISSFNEVADTNIEAVFDLILRAAVNNKVPQCELPRKLIIISDMEFNFCVNNASLTNFENAKKKYETNGYKLPQIVFWNVDSRRCQQPVTMNEQGVILVSGVTPKIFSMIMGGEFSPYKFMTEILESERYSKITA